MTARLLDAGDCAVTVELGDRIDRPLAGRVRVLEHAVRAAAARGELPGVVETMPTFRSLTVVYDPLATGRAALDPVLLRLLDRLDAAAVPEPARRWRLPVCYEGEFAADLGDVAAATGLAPGAVVELHASAEYLVYMLGFMPGFPFMGDVAPALEMPRLREPRLRVPAGSVAITGRMTGIYPWQSPGGWRILGRCAVPLFDAASAAQPSLLAPGDVVRFEPVARARFDEIRAAVAAGELEASSWQA